MPQCILASLADNVIAAASSSSRTHHSPPRNKDTPMAVCRFCAEAIPDNVTVCPVCKSNQNEPAPVQPQRSALDAMADDGLARMLLPVGRSWLAIIAGYMGLFSVLLIPAPRALLLGIVAIIHIRSNPKLHGMGRAIFAIVMGLLGTIGLVIAIVSQLK